MTARETSLPGVIIVEPQVFGDNRGWFCETYNKEKMSALGIDMEFIQDNQSMSVPKFTLRGIHFQNEPYAQSKLVRCVAGKILDFAIDLRKGSPTYLKWVTVELSAENKLQLFIPKGFGHGFLTLEDNSQVCYKVDDIWSRECERSIIYSDPDIALELPEGDYILSDKDRNAPMLKDCDCNFRYNK